MVRSDVPTILLIRGVPGSGKSTLAKRCAGFVHIETDQFFSRTGVYRFERMLLRDAHHWCLAETKLHISQGEDVVVSNTFCKLKSLTPYLELPATVRVFTAEGVYRNCHGVPAPKVQAMRDTWEPYPDTEPLADLPAVGEGLALADAQSPEDQDRAIFDLVLSGHPEAAILEYVESQGHADPVAIILRATQRFVDQAERTPVAAQCGFLLDSFRELARKSTEIGDYGGARGNLKEYMAVVKYLAEHGLVRVDADDSEGDSQK